MTVLKCMIALSFVISFVCCRATGFTQTAPLPNDTIPGKTTLAHPVRLLLSNLHSSNYLNAYMALKEQEQAYMASPFKSSFLETMVLISGYVSEYAAAVAYDSLFRKNRRSPGAGSNFDDLNLSPYMLCEAIQKVARQEQVVMVNEEHRFPQHRALTASLLQAFYNEGFRYFALETLTAKDSLLHKRGYATQRSGFYSADPVYAGMVREALRIGYTIVPYEWEEDCQGNNCDNERERGQAVNLYERILKANPRAKILVHVGRAHNAEVRENDSTAFMAWHFREITGIDPFTIDQLFYSDNSGREFQTPLYRAFMEKNKLASPAVIANQDGSFYRAGSYDMHIVHPPNTYVNDRPTWLVNERSAHPVDTRKLGLGNVRPGHALIQALSNPQDSLEVPVDQVLFKTGGQQLLLPQGRFVIRAVDCNNVVLGSYWLDN